MRKIFLWVVGFMFVATACTDNEGTTDNDSFDRAIMLEQMADNIIIPDYASLQTLVGTLKTNTEAFTANPTTNNLASAKQAWQAAYMQWQRASLFDFGPAVNNFGTLRENIGTFPVTINTTVDANNNERIGIEDFIAQGDVSLNNFNRDTHGFLAVEYLLYGADEATVVQQVSQSANRAAYLNSLVNDIEAEVTAVYNAWTGSYRQTFIENTGTDAGSSASLLFNEFSKGYELIKNFKVGLPAGKRPNQTSPEPTKTEAFYSGMSLELIKANFDAVVKLWNGQDAAGQDGTGFVEYLQSVEGGEALITSTQTQISATLAAINAIPNGALSQTIESNFTAVDNAHTEMQKLTRFFKSDMESLLGIAITFNSGDGD